MRETGTAVPETEKLIAISTFFDVSLDYLIKDKEPPETPQTAETDTPKNLYAGLIICIVGVLCLVIWGIISIVRPATSEQIGASSVIQIDGNGIFLIVCITTILVGAWLLLKNNKK